MSRFKKQKLLNENDKLTNDLIDSNHFDIDDYINDLAKNSSNMIKSSIKKPVQLKTNELMQENLRIGTSTAIDSSNKGFSLLSKFGYSGKGGLGKEGQGLVNPLDINIRDSKDKTGIGILEEQQKKLLQFQEKMKELIVLRENMIKDFRLRLSFQNEIKNINRYIRKAEKIIHEFDIAASMSTNKNLWPEDILLDNDSSIALVSLDKSNDDISIEKLNQLTGRLEECLMCLRDQYHYCLFCGCKYNDLNDLITTCPGILEQEH